MRLMNLYLCVDGKYIDGEVSGQGTIPLGAMLYTGLRGEVYEPGTEGERLLGWDNGMDVFCKDLDNECYEDGDMIEVDVGDLTILRYVAMRLCTDNELTDYHEVLNKVVALFGLAIEKYTEAKVVYPPLGGLLFFRWL